MVNPTIKPLAADTKANVPFFRFQSYEVGADYYNDGRNIDFVTDGNSLYVCAVEHIHTTANKISEQNGLLKLVSEGKQGIQGVAGKNGLPGETPDFQVQFDGKQLIVLKDGVRKAVSSDLTGPSWKPVVENETISWERTYDAVSPESINLNDLRVPERPILFRTNSDNTKRQDETSGPAVFIQWKYEGDPEWRNLISISELMNLALAGVNIWPDEDTGKLHFGHREVIRATYSSGKNDRKIISDVELGDILFDAGELPYDDNTIAINAILERLDGIDEILRNLPSTDLSEYLKKTEAQQLYQPKGNYVKSVKINGTSHTPNANTGEVDLGTISGGGGGDVTGVVKKIVLDGTEYNPDSNGKVTISLSSKYNLFDLFIRNKHLIKSINGVETDLGSIGDGTGSGLSESDVKHLIGLILEGTLDSAIPEYIKGSDHNYFIRLDDLANYATKKYVDSKIADALTDQGDLDYYRIFTLYQRTNSRTTIPAAPVQGNFVWDTAKGEIVSTVSSNWKNHPDNATTATPYLWMASATYSYKSKSEVKGDDETEYWHVICLTGEPGVAGSDGADGNGVEFIYTLIRDRNDISGLQTPVAPSSSSEDSYPAGWEDHPQGIGYYIPENIITTLSNLGNEELLFSIEMASMRTFDGENWSSYCAPFIWSMWGEDGVDGDGVEYLFCVTAEPSIGAFANEIPLTDPAVEALGDDYQVQDWLPLNGNGNWTDNPLDVDENQPYEWVSIRKYNGVTGKWGKCSDPKIWGHWAQAKTITYNTTTSDIINNITPYTCYAFTRSNTDLSGYSIEYTFDDYSELTDIQKTQFRENPLDFIKTLNAFGSEVSNITWYDTIPSTSGQLWMINNHIGDEGGNETGWNGPFKWGDHAGFQTEYALSDTKTDAVYNKQETLTSLNAYVNDSLEGVNMTAWRAGVANRCGNWVDDGSIVDPVYMATCYKQNNGTWSNWTVAKIKGETGNPGDTGPQGPAGSPGADGTDIEFVYFRTDSELHEPGMSETEGTYDKATKTSEDPYEDDFLPKATGSFLSTNVVKDNELTIGNDFFWHDHPAGVTEALPCEWVGVRHSSYQNGEKIWGDFNIALWSKYGANGRDGDGIEYVFWPLAADQVSSITGTILPTRLNDTRPDSHNRFITDNDYLPAIDILNNGTLIEATDDNPGVTDESPYVYASMRKYDGGSKTWGQFSPIKLWLIKENPNLERITLDIYDDTQTVLVNENGVIDANYKNRAWETGKLALYRNLVLQTGGKIYVNDVLAAQTVATPVAGSNQLELVNNFSTSVTSNGVTANITLVSAYRSYESLYPWLTINVEFVGSNVVLKDPFEIPISVEDVNGLYKGTELLKLVPRTDDVIKLDHVPDVFRTTSEGTHDYSTTTWFFWSNKSSNYYSSYTLDELVNIKYWFKFDNQSWVGFQPTASDISAIKAADGVANQEFNLYFDASGNRVANVNDAFFRIRLKNEDRKDNSAPWTKWENCAYVIIEKFISTNNYPIDEVYFGVSLLNASESNDEAMVPIVYPGKDGESSLYIEGPELIAVDTNKNGIITSTKYINNEYSVKRGGISVNATWTLKDVYGLGISHNGGSTQNVYYNGRDDQTIEDVDYHYHWVNVDDPEGYTYVRYPEVGDSFWDLTSEWQSTIVSLIKGVPNMSINNNGVLSGQITSMSADSISILLIATVGTETISKTVTFIKNKQGETGPAGASAVPYTYRGQWDSSKTYYANNQRIDIVKYNNVYYYATQSGSNNTPGSDSGYWHEFEGSYENIATGFLFADSASIQNLKVAELETEDTGRGKITINAGGALGYGDNQIRGYAQNSDSAGILISGEELPAEIFSSSTNIAIQNISLSSRIRPDYNAVVGSNLSPLIVQSHDYESNASSYIKSDAININDTGYIGLSSLLPSPDITLVGYNQNRETSVYWPEDNNTITILPNIDIAILDSNNKYIGSLATYRFVDSWSNGTWTGSYIGSLNDPIYLSEAGNYYLAIVNGIGDFRSEGYDEYTNDSEDLTDMFTFTSVMHGVVSCALNLQNITLTKYDGYSRQGVTIAPNGMLIYFDSSHYFQFVKVGNNYVCRSVGLTVN